jgi:hypothetical protein
VPFYSPGQFAFGGVVLVGMYLMMLWLDPPIAAVVALGGLIGMAAVGVTSRPSRMLIDHGIASEVERLLTEHGYERRSGGAWVPPLPQWLRWSFSSIEFRWEGDVVQVTGPATVLRALAHELGGAC